MKVRFNVQGLLGIVAIALLIGVVFLKDWQIPWLYFGAAVLSYGGAVIAFSVWQEEEKVKQATLLDELRNIQASTHAVAHATTPPRDRTLILEEIGESKVIMFTLYRVLLGCHLALALQALGLLIDLSDAIVVRVGYFLASLAIGLAVPFLLLTRREEDFDQITDARQQTTDA